MFIAPASSCDKVAFGTAYNCSIQKFTYLLLKIVFQLENHTAGLAHATEQNWLYHVTSCSRQTKILTAIEFRCSVDNSVGLMRLRSQFLIFFLEETATWLSSRNRSSAANATIALNPNSSKLPAWKPTSRSTIVWRLVEVSAREFWSSPGSRNYDIGRSVAGAIAF